MKKGTKNLLVLGALGVAALYFLPNLMKAGGQAGADIASGAAGGAVTSGLDYLNPFNLLSGFASNLASGLGAVAMPSVSPTTAARAVPIMATNPVAAIRQINPDYGGAAAFMASGGRGVYTPSSYPTPPAPTRYSVVVPNSGAAAFMASGGRGVYYPTNAAPSGGAKLGPPSPPINVMNLGAPVSSGMRMAPGKTLADYQKPNYLTGR